MQIIEVEELTTTLKLVLNTELTELNGYLFQNLATIGLPFKFEVTYSLLELIISSPLYLQSYHLGNLSAREVYTKDSITLKLVCSLN